MGFNSAFKGLIGAVKFSVSQNQSILTLSVEKRKILYRQL